VALMLFVITSTHMPVTSWPGIHGLEVTGGPTKHQPEGLGFTVAERRKPAAYDHRECYWGDIGCSENSPDSKNREGENKRHNDNLITQTHDKIS
jgi:hypothetical protein